MKVEAEALSDFVHGDINATAGRVCHHRNGELLDSGLAGDLERAGLVRIRMGAAAAVTRATVTAEGKDPDDGQGQPSSVSEAAPVSPTETWESLRRGRGRPRKVDVSSS
jgi:hypothetical protein